VATIIAILVIRLTHLEKSVEEQQTKVNSQTSEIRDILKKEVRKGEQADIEEVINLVTRLTSLDTINGRLEYLDQARTKWFIVDNLSNAHRFYKITNF
jgi:predicted Holliday junction resolvase-like endonuclease